MGGRAARSWCIGEHDAIAPCAFGIEQCRIGYNNAGGNVNGGYRGAVHLASTDPTGGTQNFTFSNNDNGVHVFSYTFNALGLQTITVTDTTNRSIFGSIVVNVLAQSAGGGGTEGRQSDGGSEAGRTGLSDEDGLSLC